MVEERLGRQFFERPVQTVAEDLLGSIVVSRHGGHVTAGRIVETEAYAGPEDPASHAGRLRIGRTMMGGPAGIAYICRAYGMHVTLNVVAEPEGSLSAVLVRALDPLEGVAIMRERRGVPASVPDDRLASGPGNICRAMGIALDDNGRDLTTSDVVFLMAGPPPREIAVSGRIGLTRGTEALWRYFDPVSRAVSAHRRTATPSDGHA